jgi:predicted NBD/HSP70 family sugar kinase
MQVFFRNFGRALANLIDILDPDMVVLGGGVSNFGPFTPKASNQVRQFVFTDEWRRPLSKISSAIPPVFWAQPWWGFSFGKYPPPPHPIDPPHRIRRRWRTRHKLRSVHCMKTGIPISQDKAASGATIEFHRPNISGGRHARWRSVRSPQKPLFIGFFELKCLLTPND